MDNVGFQFRWQCNIIRGWLSKLGKNHAPPRASDQTADGPDCDPMVKVEYKLDFIMIYIMMFIGNDPT